ncbi:unnamed protein product [Linum trigynum]|uniref:Retrotransposon Copia-like N-terminal domain-containing protein n=1 Tax=Linum trigynum TaxID=586398 RepID=A0AAV2EPU7_9ROSI
MEGQKGDVIVVRFNGKNFALWEFQFRIYVQGRRLRGILDGSIPEPAADASAKVKEDWAVNNASVMSILLSSMDPGISLSLRGFSTAADMWRHLSALYSKASASRKFDVELDLANLKQGDRDVSTYYQDEMTLWTEHDLLLTSLVPTAASTDVIHERAASRVMRFLMNLCAEFEGIRASLLHCSYGYLGALSCDLSSWLQIFLSIC